MTKEQSALALLKSVDSKLGRFYDALTDTLVRELDSINGKALAKLIERLETQLERDADGRIARTSKNLTRLAGLDADYVKVMDKFGHRKAITAFVGEFPKQLPSLAEQLSVISGQLKRGPLNVKEILAAPKVQDMLSAQQSMTVEDMHTVAARVAVQAKRKVMLQYGALDRFQMSEMLSDQLGRTIGETRTLGATGLAMFHRVAHEKVMDVVDEGKKLPYVYDGPDDKLTRPFCQELKRQMAKGKVWTRAEIDAMKNGQLADCFTTGGGYNCRHQWRLALDEELPKPTPEELAAIAAKEAAEREAAEEEAARRAAEEEARQATAAAAWAATEPVSKEVAQKRLAALPVKKGEKKSVHIPVIEPNDAEMKSLASAMKAAEASGVSLADAKPFTLDPGAYTNLKSLERQDWVERAKVSKLIDTFEDWSEGSEHNFAGQNVVLVKHQGELYMSDGHHRATAAKLLGRPMQARLVDLDEAAAKAKALAEAEAAAKAAAEAAAKAKAEAEAAEKAAAAAKSAAEAKAKAIADAKAALAPHIKKIANGSIHGAKAASFSHEEAQAMGKLHDKLEALEPGAYMPLMQAEIAAAKAKQLEAAKQTFAPLFEKKVLKVNGGKLSPDDLKMYLEASDIIKANGGEPALTAMKAQVEADAAPLLAAQKLVDLKAQMKPMMAAIMKGEQPSPQFQPLVNELYKLSGGGGEAMSELLSELAAEKDAADKLAALKAKAKPILTKFELNKDLSDQEYDDWESVKKALKETPGAQAAIIEEIKAEVEAERKAAAEAEARKEALAKRALNGGRQPWQTPMDAHLPGYDPLKNTAEMKKRFLTRDGSPHPMTSGEAKAEVAQGIESRLAANQEWKKFVQETRRRFIDQPGKTSELKAVSGIVQTWANTSADHNELSLGVQYAISEEFGTPYPKFLKESYADGEARQFFEENEEALRAFVRAMHDNTQAYFKKHNITSVWAYRGMKTHTPAAWEPDLKKDGFRFGAAGVELQPASSFSAEYRTSREDFANSSRGVMIAAEIPVERILGTCRSGFGCLSETEFVVIGGQKGEDQFYTNAWSTNNGRNRVPTPEKFVEYARLHASGADISTAKKKVLGSGKPLEVELDGYTYKLDPKTGEYKNDNYVKVKAAAMEHNLKDGSASVTKWEFPDLASLPKQVTGANSGQVYTLKDGKYFAEGNPHVFHTAQHVQSGLDKGSFKEVAPFGGDDEEMTPKKPAAAPANAPQKVVHQGIVYELQASGYYKDNAGKTVIVGGGQMNATNVQKSIDYGAVEVVQPKAAAPVKIPSTFTYKNDPYVVFAQGEWMNQHTGEVFPKATVEKWGVASAAPAAPLPPAPVAPAGPPQTVISKKGTKYFWIPGKNGYESANGNFFTKGEVEGALKAGTFTVQKAAAMPPKVLAEKGEILTLQPDGSYLNKAGDGTYTPEFVQSELKLGLMKPYADPADAASATKVKQTPVAKPLLVKQQDAVKAAKVTLSKGKKLVDKHVLALHTMDAAQVAEQFSTVQQDALLKAGVLNDWQVDIPF